MRQVPFTKYLLVGGGHLAFHLNHYLSLLQLPFRQWQRSEGQPLQQCLQDCSHILLAVSDRAIGPLIEELKSFQQEKIFIHFSGAVCHPKAYRAHPLMTFSRGQPYEEEEYQRIPFTIDCTGPALEDLLPGVPNPSYRISEEETPLYHACCALASNLPQWIWHQVCQAMEENWGIPQEAVAPCLEQSLRNFVAHGSRALTGPAIRGDLEVLTLHKQALKHSSLEGLYHAYIQSAIEEKDA